MFYGWAQSGLKPPTPATLIIHKMFSLLSPRDWFISLSTDVTYLFLSFLNWDVNISKNSAKFIAEPNQAF